MPSSQLQPQKTAAEVLARAAQITGVSRLTERFVPLNKVRNLYQRLHRSEQGFQMHDLLSEMQIELQVTASDMARIPKNGPVVVVANHPFGVLDGAILTSLLTEIRPDVKVMANYLLDDVPELQRYCIFVDPFGSDHSIDTNRRPLKEALHWLRAGGMLAVFPAGEVSHWQFSTAQVVDPVWNETATRLIRRTGAKALPVYFCGQNSLAFQIFGMIHPRVRTAFLLQQFLQQQGKQVEVRIGTEIGNRAIYETVDDHEATEYLRWRTYLLAHRGKRPSTFPAAVRSALSFIPETSEPVARPLAQELLAQEIDSLPGNQRLTENRDFAVYVARTEQIPNCLQELGRLRELTFRESGEGTGKARDLDQFDKYYEHLFLWHKRRNELVGAYRIGRTSEILPKYGIDGLYSSTLFKYDPALFESLGPALELGRSFVVKEYQRQYGPLLLLWKGISAIVAARPENAVLFGAVSISDDYNPASRQIIYRYFESCTQQNELCLLVKPRRPFRPPLTLRNWDCRAMCRVLHDLEDLSDPVTDVESDRKGLPVLLRQYARVGGKLLAFNVDQRFSNVLDGLVVVDLRQTESALLERYMGREAASRFQLYHRCGPQRQSE